MQLLVGKAVIANNLLVLGQTATPGGNEGLYEVNKR